METLQLNADMPHSDTQSISDSIGAEESSNVFILNADPLYKYSEHPSRGTKRGRLDTDPPSKSFTSHSPGNAPDLTQDRVIDTSDTDSGGPRKRQRGSVSSVSKSSPVTVSENPTPLPAFGEKTPLNTTTNRDCASAPHASDLNLQIHHGPIFGGITTANETSLSSGNLNPASVYSKHGHTDSSPSEQVDTTTSKASPEISKRSKSSSDETPSTSSVEIPGKTATPHSSPVPTTNPSLYAYLYPSPTKNSHETQSRASHLYHYQSQSQYPTANSGASSQTPHYHGSSLDFLYYPLSQTHELPPSSEQNPSNLHIPQNSVVTSIQTPKPDSKRSSTPPVPEETEIPSSVIQRNADALFDLFTQGLREAQTKYEAVEANLAANHQQHILRLITEHTVELRRLETAPSLNESEILERVNAALVVKEQESDKLITSKKNEIIASYQQQLGIMEGRFKKEYQAKLDRLAAEYRGMLWEGQQKLDEAEAKIKILKERELGEVKSIREKDLAEWKKREEQLQRESDHRVVLMREKWETEKRLIESSLDEEKKWLNGELTRLKSTDEGTMERHIKQGAPIFDEEHMRKSRDSIKRILEANAAGVTRAEIEEDLARVQKMMSRDMMMMNPSSDIAWVALEVDKRKLDKEKDILAKNAANFEEEKQNFETVKKRLETWAEELRSAVACQGESDKRKWEDEETRWEHLMKTEVQKTREEAESVGYRRAMATMEKERQEWRTTATKESEEAKEAIEKERKMLAKEKEILKNEKHEIVSRESEEAARIQAADKLRVAAYDNIWAKEIEDRWARFIEVETKKRELERKQQTDEAARKDVEMERCKRELKAMEDKVKLLEAQVQGRERPTTETSGSSQLNATRALEFDAKGMLERMISDDPSEWNRSPCFSQ